MQIIENLTATDLLAGDRILGWMSDDEPVDVTEDRGDWIVDGVLLRPEDAPSYRRHRHGFAQITFADSYLEIPEDAPIIVRR